MTNISTVLTNRSPKETTMSRCRDLMTTNPVSCSSTDTVRSAAQLMKREDVGFLPVVREEEDKKLIGVVTDRDLVLNLIVEARQADMTTIADVMTAKPVACRADDDLEQALSAMAQHQIRRVPIVDESQQIVGIIAQADIALRIDDPTATTEVLRKISKPTPVHPSMAIAE
jgi:CBS domain-containing protein